MGLTGLMGMISEALTLKAIYSPSLGRVGEGLFFFSTFTFCCFVKV